MGTVFGAFIFAYRVRRYKYGWSSTTMFGSGESDFLSNKVINARNTL